MDEGREIGSKDADVSVLAPSADEDEEDYGDFVLEGTKPVADEDVRFWFLKALLVIYALTLAAGFTSAIGGWHWDNAKDLFNVVLSGETALLGAAAGFYFAAKNKS